MDMGRYHHHVARALQPGEVSFPRWTKVHDSHVLETHGLPLLGRGNRIVVEGAARPHRVPVGFAKFHPYSDGSFSVLVGSAEEEAHPTTPRDTPHGSPPRAVAPNGYPKWVVADISHVGQRVIREAYVPDFPQSRTNADGQCIGACVRPGR